MQFTFAYRTPSSVQTDSAGGLRVGLSPDLNRAPAFFNGALVDPVSFREAAGALHDVVVADLKYRPADKTAYHKWRAEQIARVGTEYWTARREWMNLLYRTDREAWMVLDPVITVHPDQVFFEAFSKDESSYARLSVEHSAFTDVREFACGTTNIDFSAALYGQFQRIRSNRPTRLEIDPGGLTVQRQGSQDYREKKIDVPDSWVRGFLRVQSAMTLPGVAISVRPMDLYNLCVLMRRRRERKGPRALRWELTPGAPAQVVLEPWETRLTFAGSTWAGDVPVESNPLLRMGVPASETRADAVVVRTWGRRRLHVLERLLPLADRAEIVLLGRGLPTFYLVRMGRLTFCLGLSGWTRNDWTASARFDLFAPRREVSNELVARLHAELRRSYKLPLAEAASRMQVDPGTAEAALTRLCREGRVMYDRIDRAYRLRELTREPLPIDHLAFRDEREAEAVSILRNARYALASHALVPGKGWEISGEVKSSTGGVQRPKALVDFDGRLLSGECGCVWHGRNKLRKGPCGHLLALRLAAESSAGR